jgi:hypothetical protein
MELLEGTSLQVFPMAPPVKPQSPPALARNRILFAVWVVASIVWAFRASDISHFDSALKTYSQAMALENQINDGDATSYQKKLYMSYGTRLEVANGRILIFMVTGIGIPVVILLIGRWIFMRAANPAPAKRKPPETKKRLR